MTKGHTRWHQKAAVTRLWNFAPLLTGTGDLNCGPEMHYLLLAVANTAFFIQWWWQLSLNLISLTLFKKYYHVRKKEKKKAVSHISSCSRTTRKPEYGVLSAIFTNYALRKKEINLKTTYTALPQNSITSQEQTTAIHYHGVIYNMMECYAYNKLHLILFLLNSDICKLMLILFILFSPIYFPLCILSA